MYLKLCLNNDFRYQHFVYKYFILFLQSNENIKINLKNEVSVLFIITPFLKMHFSQVNGYSLKKNLMNTDISQCKLYFLFLFDTF